MKKWDARAKQQQAEGERVSRLEAFKAERRRQREAKRAQAEEAEKIARLEQALSEQQEKAEALEGRVKQLEEQRRRARIVRRRRRVRTQPQGGDVLELAPIMRRPLVIAGGQPASSPTARQRSPRR